LIVIPCATAPPVAAIVAITATQAKTQISLIVGWFLKNMDWGCGGLEGLKRIHQVDQYLIGQCADVDSHPDVPND